MNGIVGRLVAYALIFVFGFGLVQTDVGGCRQKIKGGRVLWH